MSVSESPLPGVRSPRFSLLSDPSRPRAFAVCFREMARWDTSSLKLSGIGPPKTWFRSVLCFGFAKSALTVPPIVLPTYSLSRFTLAAQLAAAK